MIGNTVERYAGTRRNLQDDQAFCGLVDAEPAKSFPDLQALMTFRTQRCETYIVVGT